MIADVSDAVKIWNMIMISIASLMVIFNTVFMYRYRRHPMVVVRYPTILSTDIQASAFNAIWQALVMTNIFGASVACQPFMAIGGALDCCANISLIGRAVLFYNQTRAMNHTNGHWFLDMVVDGFALVTAPGDYFRLRQQILANKQPDVRQRAASVNSAVSQSSSSRWKFRPSEGSSRYISMQASWFNIGLLYSFFSTYGVLGSNVFKYDVSGGSSPLQCWSGYIYPYTATLYAITSIAFLAVLISVYKVRDLVGLRNDLVVTMSIGIIFKIVNAVIIGSSDYNYAQWTYAPASLISPLISIVITVYYVLQTNTTSSEDFSTIDAGSIAENIPGINNFEEFMKKPKCLELVRDISKKLYMYENVRFIEETNKLTESCTRDQFKHIYAEFISTSAKFEINLPANLRTRARALVSERRSVVASSEQPHVMSVLASPQEIAALIVEMRSEIFSMLQPLVRHHLRHLQPEPLKFSLSVPSPTSQVTALEVVTDRNQSNDPTSSPAP